MIMISLTVVVAVIIVITTVYGIRTHHQAKLLGVQRSLTRLVALKDILIHIQRHRGLSTSLLHGDLSQKAHLANKKDMVDSQFQSLLTNYPEINEDSLFEGIYSHWQRLAQRCLELSASNNIVQHNRLITNLLYLIENLAEENRLLMRFTLEAHLEVLWKELLETIEAIGQTRAIGMGIISAGKSTAVERIQLKYLCDKVDTRIEALTTSFRRNNTHRSTYQAEASQEATRYIETAVARIEQLKNFIYMSLLVSEIKDVSGEKFFQLASVTIEPLDALFNLSSNSIKNRCTT